jgi:hypothetical protein
LPYAGDDLRNWSRYDCLRIDFKSTKPIKVWLTVEDEEIEPPVARTYDVPPGKWVTLELDLNRAARERELDLRHITNFHLLGRVKDRATVRVDNVRVARRCVAERLTCLRDQSTMKLPKLRLPAKPIVPKLSRRYKRDRSAVKLTEPVKITTGSLVPFGWMAAADNKHLICALTRGEHRVNQRVAVIQSKDGGKSWQRLPKPRARNFDHGTSRGSVIDANGDSVTLSSGVGCAGIGIATPRQILCKYTFTGTSYEKRRWPSPLDSDIRHCGSAVSVIRLNRGPKKGRLWAAWGAIDRRRRLVVHARFSDDDGVTWHHLGKTAMVPGSAAAPFSINTYSYQQARVTYLRGHVAIYWQDSRGLLWSRFDGKRWSRAQVINAKLKAKVAVGPNESFRVPGSAVTLGEEDIYLTAWNCPGVLHYNGRRWKRELGMAADAGALTVCGSKKLMLVTMGHTEEPPEYKRKQITREAEVLCYRRRPNGTWAAPIDLAGGKVTLHEYRQMTAVAVPPMSPTNFAPVAFSDGDTIKFVRVPVL